jgi:trans-L-3-hydroxyproline dehydratase
LDSEKLRAAWLGWEPGPGATRILTVDAHAEGEPLRVILGGFPELAGDTILARRRDARERFDRLRRTLMWEPRGHADMYGCLVTPPVTDAADFGVLFMHNEGFSTMCGHGIIAVTRVVLDLGLIPKEEPLTPVGIDTPAGFVQAHARVTGGEVRSVFFRNVPSFVHALDQRVEVPGLGEVRYDLAFGGAYYAYVEAASVGVGLTGRDHEELVTKGRAIKQAVMAGGPIEHPADPDLGFLYGTIFVGAPQDPAHHSRNVCVFADGEVDRSPTGTGVSGRLALHHARGEVAVDEAIVIESILGTSFTGRIAELCEVDGRNAIVPEVEGRAYLTGWCEWSVDPKDPLAGGFVLR